MTRRMTVYLTLSLWTSLTFACGDDPVSEDTESPARKLTSDTTNKPDPKDALAAIPERMRPARLLPALEAAGLLIPDVENEGLAMFTEVVTVEPGADVTFCTYLPGLTEKTSYVHDSLGVQSKYGHHVLLQYARTPQAPGTHRCDPESIEAQQNQVISGTGGEGVGVALPSHVVSEVPAGSQFMINHHWINASDEPIEVQAEVITVPPHAGDDLLIAHAIAIVVTDFNVPAQQTAEHSGECAIPEAMDMLSMTGHAHRWGTHVKAERMGDAPDVILDHDYREELVTHPLTMKYPLDAPYRLNEGDRVRMTCQWKNTTDSTLLYPQEMCILIGWRIGGTHDTACFSGTWL